MSRRTVVAALAGALLLAGLSTPAVAGPIFEGEDETRVCVRIDSDTGERGGVCVAVPIGR